MAVSAAIRRDANPTCKLRRQNGAIAQADDRFLARCVEHFVRLSRGQRIANSQQATRHGFFGGCFR
jgi:hypothetical protein